MKVKIFYNNNEKSIEVYEKLAKKLENNGFILDNDNYDYAIAIGGDGAFLRMVRETNFNSDTLFLGVNTGTLGFAQDISVENIDELVDDLKNNNYFKEEIKVVKAKIYVKDKIYELNALNEFVFRSSDFKTLKLNIEIDSELNIISIAVSYYYYDNTPSYIIEELPVIIETFPNEF